MPNTGYFNTKRDNELIAAGTHFWCEACLVARPLDDQSPDPRYCLICYEFLLKEAALLLLKQGRPEWVPKTWGISKKAAGVSEYTPQIMATVESRKNEVAIIPPPVGPRPVIRRGPKHKALPVGVIRKLAGQGMGSKKIAARLKDEYGIKVSFRTVARVLSGERQLALPISREG